MAAMATTFKLARQKPFIDFQKQILKNCKALNDQLKARGFRIAYNGSNTHLTNNNTELKKIQKTKPHFRNTMKPSLATEKNAHLETLAETKNAQVS